MEDHHKVRVYHDFPILLDYLKDAKEKRLCHLDLDRLDSSKEYEDKQNVQINNHPRKINSISFTRKIIDLQNEENNIQQPKNRLENQKILPLNSISPDLWKRNYIVDQQITSSCQNKSRFFAMDGSLYCVDHLNKIVIDNSNLFVCKRINDDMETFESEDYSKNNSMRIDRNFQISKGLIKSVKNDKIDHKKTIKDCTIGKNRLESKINTNEKTKFEKNSQKSSQMINSNQKIHIKLNSNTNKNIENFFERIYTLTSDSFSDLIEEEYKMLPKISSYKNKTIFNKRQTCKNNSIIKDNGSQTNDVELVVNNNDLIQSSCNKEVHENENNYKHQNQSMIDEFFGKTIDLPCERTFETSLSITIPNWEELCVRVYRLNNNRTYNTNDTTQNAPNDQNFKNFQFFNNCYFVMPNGLLDVSSSQTLNDNSFFTNNINKDFSKNVNFVESFNHAMTNNRIGENFDIKSSKFCIETGISQLAPIVDTEISIENFDLENFVCQQAKRIFLLREEVINENRGNHQSPSQNSNLKHLIEKLPYDFNDYSPMTSYKLFLFDLCKETIMDMFLMDVVDHDLPNSIELTLMLPLNMQKQPWPLNADVFAQLVFDCVKKTLFEHSSSEKQLLFGQNSNHAGFQDCNNNLYKKNSTNMKRFGLMAFCRMQRKLDFVDRVLYQEMLNDQARWSYFEPEICEIKNLICDMILEELIFNFIQSQTN